MKISEWELARNVGRRTTGSGRGHKLKGQRIGLRSIFVGFRDFSIACAVFFLLNIAVFFLIQHWHGLLQYLWLSKNRPWGIVTANFTQATSIHIGSNLGGFAFIALGFLAVCLTFTVKVRRRWGRIFLWLTFLSGALWGTIQYLLFLFFQSSGSGYGASIMVYSFLGIFFIAYIHSLFPLRAWVNNLKRGWNSFIHSIPRKRKRGWKSFIYSTSRNRMSKKDFKNILIANSQIVALCIFGILMVVLITNPADFLGVGVNLQGIGRVSWQGHLFGFLFGFLGALFLLKAKRP